MKVLISGLTGFIGRHIGAALVNRGHQVVALTRNKAHARMQLSFPCELYEWNVEAGEVEAGAFEQVDAVINLAGHSVANGRWTKKTKEKILRSRVDATKLLIKNALGAKVIVNASAIGIYGDRRDEILTEESPRGEGFLADVCNQWESALFDGAYSGRKVAVRIGFVLGADGGALSRIIPMFRLGVAAKLGSGRQWMSWIHVQDLASLFVYLVENDFVAGVVNGVAPTPVTNDEFTHCLAKLLKTSLVLSVPSPVIRVLLGEASQLLLWSQRVTSCAEAKLFEFKFKTLNKALDDVLAPFL